MVLKDDANVLLDGIAPALEATKQSSILRNVMGGVVSLIQLPNILKEKSHYFVWD